MKGFPQEREAAEAAQSGMEDNWHWQRGYDAGARDLEECRIENDRINRLLGESNAETVKVQDDLGRLLHTAESDRDMFWNALLRLHRAVRGLGRMHGSRTFFECKPTDSRECCDAWLELNKAQVQAADVLPFHEVDGRAMAPDGLSRKLPGQADD